MPVIAVQVSPPFVDRSTSPPLPTARPIWPPFWNSMSFSGTPPAARTCANVPFGWRLKIAPAAVVNQNREADWYSIAVMFCVVPDGISVQMLAEAGWAMAAEASDAATAARERRMCIAADPRCGCTAATITPWG